MLKTGSFKARRGEKMGYKNEMKERLETERKQTKQSLLSPEGSKQNRKTEGLCFPCFLNGVEKEELCSKEAK